MYTALQFEHNRGFLVRRLKETGDNIPRIVNKGLNINSMMYDVLGE